MRMREADLQSILSTAYDNLCAAARTLREAGHPEADRLARCKFVRKWHAGEEVNLPEALRAITRLIQQHTDLAKPLDIVVTDLRDAIAGEHITATRVHNALLGLAV